MPAHEAILFQGWTQIFGTVVIGVLGFLIGRWQLQISREKLRRDSYDRRFAIYMAFHELLVAISEKQDAETEFRKANAMRAQALFLLDAPLDLLLKELLKEAFRMIQTPKLLLNPSAWPSEQDQNQAAAQFGPDKLKFVARIEELARAFERFLKVKDFA
ncbi:MAG: hypothetical protein WB764_26805 [Xanthobacteraceae bacterium]